MVALPQQFNVNERDERGGGGMVLITPGQHQAVIVNSEMRSTKSGGQALVLKVIVTQGQHKDAEFEEWLNIVNSNDVAVKIAYDTLAEISKAMGMTQTPADSSDLHNKPIIIDVKTEEGKPWTDDDGNSREGKPRSVIKKYLPLPQGSSSGSPFGNGAPAPAQSAPQPAQAQPQPQAAQAPAKNPFSAG